MNKFRIYAWPAYSTRNLNPYNYIIYKRIAERGYPVHDFYIDGKNQLLPILRQKEVRILHIHWPTSNVVKEKNYFIGLYRVIVFFILLKLLRHFGKKILWTVHNLEEHEKYHPFLQMLMNRILYSNVDGFISMNKSGLRIIRNRLRQGQNQKISYIRHPHYKDYYNNYLSRSEARCRLNIPDNAFVFLFLGQIRQYKNVNTLINAFNGLNDRNTILIIAGKIHRDVGDAGIRDLIGGNNRIILENSFIAEQALQIYFNAADLVVNPFRKIFNSGSVFLNLSFSKPTLAPDVNAISELKRSVGSQWIKTYNGELTPRHLLFVMEEVKQEQENSSDPHPHIESFDPDIVAEQTIEFYKSFLS